MCKPPLKLGYCVKSGPTILLFLRAIDYLMLKIAVLLEFHGKSLHRGY